MSVQNHSAHGSPAHKGLSMKSRVGLVLVGFLIIARRAAVHRTPGPCFGIADLAPVARLPFDAPVYAQRTRSSRRSSTR